MTVYASGRQAIESRRAQASPGGSLAVQVYSMADATVIQNSIGASISGEEITIPGGTAATTPAAAGAVIYEWALRDQLGNAFGALTGPIAGLARIVELISPGQLTDVLAVMSICGGTTGEEWGLGAQWSDATQLLGSAWGSNAGSWSSGAYTGADYRSVMGSWNLIQSDTGSPANMRVNQMVAHDYPGNTTANTRRATQNLTATNLGGTPTLRLAIMRTAGSAGDKTLSLQLRTNVLEGI